MNQNSSELFDVEQFASDLSSLVNSVLRLEIRDSRRDGVRGASTCWLITPSIAVFPAHNILDFDFNDINLRCYRSGSTDSISARVVGNPTRDGVVAVQLNKEACFSALKLTQERSLPGDSLVLPAFIDNQTRLGFSIGRFGALDSLATMGSAIHYQTRTGKGSSGAPVLDKRFGVIGMHYGTRDSGSAFGIGIVELLEELKQLSVWPEIAAYQRLAIPESNTRSVRPSKEYVKQVIVNELGKKSSLSYESDDSLEGVASNPRVQINIDEYQSDEEVQFLENIIHKTHRPALRVRKGSWAYPNGPWGPKLEGVRKILSAAIGSVGRIQFLKDDKNRILGTGFLAGEDIVYTSRKVAQRFCGGLGIEGLSLGQNSVGINFSDDPDSLANQWFEFVQALLIHPYLDIAVMRITQCNKQALPGPLEFSRGSALSGTEVVMVGHPTLDPGPYRKFVSQLLDNEFGVKRIQPGFLRGFEPIRSFGRSISMVTHDCATFDAGNWGAPLIDLRSGKVIAIQSRSEYLTAGYAVPVEALASDEKVANRGLIFQSKLTKSTRFDDAWNATERNLDSVRRAAVLWEFDPVLISEDSRQAIESLVVESDLPMWSLRSEERKRIIASSTHQDLKLARGSDEIDAPGQLAIDRILEGPPFDLNYVEYKQLPYWLQAVRWFQPAISGLPTPFEVNQNLKKRRFWHHLEMLAGDKFQGRDEQLKSLHDWYARTNVGPMMITGIGGIGKSALLSRFVKEIPRENPVLWLDFDRADLSPDDADSVVNRLWEQLQIQRDIRKPSPSHWTKSVKKLGKAIASEPALIILDGFEVAQHVRKYNEIWDVLDELLKASKGAHVVVAGRAPVPRLRIANRKAEYINLIGLPVEVAVDILLARGVDDEKVAARVAKISLGVPLILKLAADWVKRGGDVSKLPNALPKEIVAGFLYTRILNRVVSLDLLPIARDALVFRRITVDLLVELLKEKHGNTHDPKEVYESLSKELALVHGAEEEGATLLHHGTEFLKLRHEVRSATVMSLEMDNKDRVREIDQFAVDWYARQDLSHNLNRAELIFHLLRLGKTSDAEEYWNEFEKAKGNWSEDCHELLASALGELRIRTNKPSRDAASWLKRRLGRINNVSNLIRWELDAFDRIQAALRRNRRQIISGILQENDQRSSNSVLHLYDAWQYYQAGELKRARDRIANVGELTTEAQIGPAVMAAFLDRELNELNACEDLLERLALFITPYKKKESWELAATINAARIDLTINFDLELNLWRILRESSQSKSTDFNLSPFDVVLPSVLQVSSPRAGLESSGMFINITEPSENEWFLDEYLEVSEEVYNELPQPAKPYYKSLSNNIKKRWQIAIATEFDSNDFEKIIAGRPSPRKSAIYGTLALLSSSDLAGAQLTHFKTPVIDIISKIHSKAIALLSTSPTVGEAPLLVNEAKQMDWKTSPAMPIADLLNDKTFRYLAIYCSTPDPLLSLVDYLIGVPERDTWSNRLRFMQRDS